MNLEKGIEVSITLFVDIGQMEVKHLKKERDRNSGRGNGQTNVDLDEIPQQRGRERKMHLLCQE